MAYKNDWKARQKKIDTPPKSKAGYTATDTEDTTDAPNVARSVSERGDLGGSKPGMTIRGGPAAKKRKAKVKGRGVDDTAVKDKSPRVKTAFEKRQKALRTQAVKDALKDPKKKKKTATQLSREFVKEKKEKSALDKQTDAFVAEKEAGRSLPKRLQKQVKPRSSGGRGKKNEAPGARKAEAFFDKHKPKTTETATVKVPERKTYGPNVSSKPGMTIRGGPAARKRKAKLTGTGVDDTSRGPKPPKALPTDRPAQTYPKTTAKVTTPEPKKNGAGEASKRATAKDATDDTGGGKMGDRPEDRGQRKDYDHFLSSKGGIKGFQRNPFGKNKTVAEASKSAKEAYDREQIDRKRPGQSDHYQYGEGRRSQKKKGGTIKAKKGGAIKRSYNTGGTIRLKSGGAVVDTYDY